MTFEKKLGSIIYLVQDYREAYPDPTNYHDQQKQTQDIIDRGNCLVKDFRSKALTSLQQESIIKTFVETLNDYLLIVNKGDNYKAQGDYVLNHLSSLLLKKNHDYGSSYAKVAKVLGVANSFSVRILDKCNRLEQLMTTDNQVKDESINDTIRDLLGYYLLFLVCLRFN